ncbi:ATP-binding cassette domain-containing protein [Geotoga petraea]|uniref:ABC-type multidrug transport system, ATPase and permease component n=3 Tax=Geotoga petraea TaxID=28234 RepID=A0A1G6P229_9BACT|nr:ABC transporter ATP-binding protein [Geotoga petraea]SDC74058.1 ABC-type multidrug transport system, ATPase and permease component [Geotoga petraea]
MKNEFFNKTKKEVNMILWIIKNIEIKERFFLLFITFGALIILGINLYIPFVYKNFIAMSQETIAVKLIILFAILYAISLSLNYIFNYFSSLITYKIEKFYKEKLYKKIYLNDIKEIIENGSSYFSEVISFDIKKASEVLNIDTVNSMLSIFVAIIAIIILGFVNLGAAIISIIYFSLYIYVFLRPSMKKHKGKIPGFEEYSKLMEDSRQLVSYVNDSLEGREVIKESDVINQEESFFKEKSKELYFGFKNIWTQELKNFHFPFRLLSFLYYTFIFLWFYTSNLLNSGITIGNIFFTLTYINIISENIEPFMNFLFKNRNYYAPSINKMKEIIETEEKVEKRYDIGEIKEIKIKDLDFSYGEKEIFNKVNITIKKGEKVAIIGKSGEGKTTFIKLITGNETPEKGETLINDKPTNEIKNIYEKIGVLSQNSHIFNRSIKENITMGREISEEKLNNILHITGVEKFINEKTVGQNGKNLSGGQRVRVALARMMISDPEVVILDEPLEGVDKIREEEVIKNIKKYTKDKTVIIISHRFSILNMAKRIIGIENGKVVLDGEKEEALKNKTILKDFFDAENRMTVMKKGEDVIE